MCRHCERLVEDVADKELMHSFMLKSAEKLSRLHGIQIDADEVSIVFEIRKRPEFDPVKHEQFTRARARIMNIFTKAFE